MNPLLDRHAPNAASALHPMCSAAAAAAGRGFCPARSAEPPTRLVGGSARFALHPSTALGCLVLVCCTRSDLHAGTAGASWLSMSHSGETDALAEWPGTFPGISLHSQSGSGDSARGIAEGAASPASLSCKGDWWR